jgi:hypothetical protein
MRSGNLTETVLAILVTGFALLPATASAQETEPANIHWAYAAYFGTGWYSVSGERDVFIFRMTPRWTWSEASLDAGGDRSLGRYFKLPVSVGLDRFDIDDPLSAVDVENLSFLSVNPGIDVEIPVNETWSLRPYASVGYGQVLGESDSAWSYWGGIKSRFSFRSGALDWSILNQLGFVGYTPSDGPSDLVWPAMAALEFSRPLGGTRQDGSLLLHWHASYWFFGDDLKFSGSRAGDRLIEDQWEFGVALGKHNSPIRIWFLKFDRLGLGFRASSNGDLKGITFIARSLFDE